MITCILFQTQRRNATAGLGMRGASNVAAGGDSYKEAAKKNIFARYQETDWYLETILFQDLIAIFCMQFFLGTFEKKSHAD